MPPDRPKLSVLLITHNHRKFIAQAIEGVLMQKTNFPFELLIGEDVSTDGTREIVLDYARRFPDIIRLSLPETNLRAYRNFERIFQMSRGEYLAIVEGDDYWSSPDKLQKQADLLDAHPETSICGHRVTVHYEDGSKPDEILPVAAGGFYTLEDIIRDRSLLATASVVFRRVIQTQPAFAEALPMGDNPLFVAVAQHGTVCLLPEVMAVYRKHAAGQWHSQSEVQRDRATQQMLRAYLEHLDPKYHRTIRRELGRCAYSIGLSHFAAGNLPECRRAFHEFLGWSPLLEDPSKKLWLAFKAYLGWTFALKRALRG